MSDSFSNQRRIVVTGVGLVTPVGCTRRTFWDNLTEGRTGIGRLTIFDASAFPVRIAAEVRDWTLADVGLSPAEWAGCPRQSAFAIGAGIKAARSAGVASGASDPARFGIYLGCGEPFEDFDAFAESVTETLEHGDFRASRFMNSALRLFDPCVETEYEPGTPAMHLAGLLNAQGPNLNAVAACVSSTQAIGEAARLIRTGQADMMLCGGAHSTIHPFGVTGFQRLSALSIRNDDPASACRPFDLDRDGFVIGEGGAAFVIEELNHARQRGADILAEITGYGSAQDAFRITDSHPEGRGAARAMRRALESAGLNPEDIDYINAHGTGTVMNDRVETLAIRQAFGAAADRIPVSSTKSMLGHATTACGAIELAVCLMTLRTGVIAPTVNYDTPDPACDLDYVPNAAREASCRHVLNNSVGFGGQNAALVLSQFDEATRPAALIRKAA